MKILAIESSCDETAAAVVEDGRSVLSNVVAVAKYLKVLNNLDANYSFCNNALIKKN